MSGRKPALQVSSWHGGGCNRTCAVDSCLAEPNRHFLPEPEHESAAVDRTSATLDIIGQNVKPTAV
jgi:hypothetical protein